MTNIGPKFENSAGGEPLIEKDGDSSMSKTGVVVAADEDMLVLLIIVPSS